MRTALLLQLQELSDITGGIFCFAAAMYLPASKDCVDLVHFSAGHPSMLALLQQAYQQFEKGDSSSRLCRS